MGSLRTRRPHIGLLTALLLALPGLAGAQTTGSIRGRVVEGATDRPVATAEVSIVGTNRSSVTNAAGEFLLLNVPVGTHTLRVQMFAFSGADQQVSVAAGQVATVTFELSGKAVALDQIVVTGTAGAASKRTIGNEIT